MKKICFIMKHGREKGKHEVRETPFRNIAAGT